MTIQQILSDPSTSYWLRDAITTSLNRDPNDVRNDLEVLLKVFEPKKRWPFMMDYDEV